MKKPNVEIRPGEDLSVLQGDRLSLIQGRNGYRVSFDPFLLADFTACGPGKRVIEFGAGCSALSILLARKLDPAVYIAIEIQEEEEDILDIEEADFEDEDDPWRNTRDS